MLPRWTIDEIRARYELEPSLRDFFVEGSFDQELFERAAIGQGSKDVRIYSIDSVEIPNERLVALNLTEGQKQRVIVLGNLLGKLSKTPKAKCLVDRDTDLFFGSLHDGPVLHSISVCTIESHFLSEPSLSRILTTGCKIKVESESRLFDSIYVTIRWLFALRLAERELGLPLKWIPLRKYLAKETGALRFDDVKYLKAILQNSGHSKRENELGADPISRGLLSRRSLVWARGHG
ncbi:MAG: hypothetical protein JNJ54_25320 [Myxococcaceae bacterium]|nr:hypothetical protein [Myxococcaceae bacterium]